MTNSIETMRMSARELANACAEVQKRGTGEFIIAKAIARLNIAVDEWCKAEGIPYENIADMEGKLFARKER